MFPNNPSDWRPIEEGTSPPPPPATQPERSPRRWSIAASLIGVALFSALIGFAVDRYVTTNFSPTSPPVAAAPTTVPSVPRIGPLAAQNGASPTATPLPSTTAAADPAQQAIQQVIQRGDEEQAQAIASNNPSVMADTSTPDFYQQQVQVNQDLTSNGVSAI